MSNYTKHTVLLYKIMFTSKITRKVIMQYEMVIDDVHVDISENTFNALVRNLQLELMDTDRKCQPTTANLDANYINTFRFQSWSAVACEML